MREPICTPGHHLGDTGDGHCSVCNARLERTDLQRIGLLLAVLSAAAVLAVLAFLVLRLFG